MTTKRTISIGLNRDGRLEVFYVAKDGTLRHNWQKSPNGLWSNEETLAAKAVHVATGVNADGRLEAFWITPEGELFHDWQREAGGKWTGAAALHVDGETKKGARAKAQTVSVASNQDGRLEVFYIDEKGHLVHDWQLSPNGDWHGAERLCSDATCGGACTAVDVGRNQDGTLEVFYATGDGTLLHDWQTVANGDWHGAETLPGRAVEVRVGSNADGRLEVFFRDPIGLVWHDWQTTPNGQWHGLESLGARARRIDVAKNRDGRLELFFVDGDGNVKNLFQASANGDWGTDDEVLGEHTTDFAIGQNQDGRLELFYWGKGEDVWHNWQPRAGQGPWNPIVQYGSDSVG